MHKVETLGFESTTRGHVVPEELTVQETKRFLRWLNDDWPPGGSMWMDLGPRSMRNIARSDSEDEPARERIVKVVLPLLQAAQSFNDDTDDEPTKSQILDAKARNMLAEIFRTYTVISTAFLPGCKDFLFVTGDNATEAWAAHILCLIARKGHLSKLKRCACARGECGKWFIASRGVDKYATKRCSVWVTQSCPDFKKARAKRKRDNYLSAKRHDPLKKSTSAKRATAKRSNHAKA